MSRDLGNGEYGLMVGGIRAATPRLGFQPRTTVALTTADSAVAIPTSWEVEYVQITCDVTFVYALDAPTSATVGTVWAAGTWAIPIRRTPGGDAMVHLAAKTGTGSADVTFLNDL